MHRRLQAMGQEKYKADFLQGAKEHRDTLEIPFKWKKPRTVFVNSMSDLFHEAVSFNFIIEVFKVMELTPKHTYLVLTKRPERALRFWLHMEACTVGDWKPPSNLWMGTSCNDQKSAAIRIPYLLQLTDCLRFLSYEPATGPVNLRHLDADGQGHPMLCQIDALTGKHTDMARPCHDVQKLDWVIMGGESGPKAVPMHPMWVRDVRDACAGAGVPFFFKQWGHWEPHRYRVQGSWVLKQEVGKGEYFFPEPHPQNMIKAKRKDGNRLDGSTYTQFPDTNNTKPWDYSQELQQPDVSSLGQTF